MLTCAQTVSYTHLRRFWIDHTKACRTIAEYFGKELGTPSLVDVWIPDGLKDVPADRMGPRKRLKEMCIRDRWQAVFSSCAQNTT